MDLVGTEHQGEKEPWRLAQQRANNREKTEEISAMKELKSEN